MRTGILTALLLFAPSVASADDRYDGPIIDMHLHAVGADMQGRIPARICAEVEQWSAWTYDSSGQRQYSRRPCDEPLTAPTTDEAIRDETIAAMRDNNVVLGMLSSSPSRLPLWMENSPELFIPALYLNLRGSNASIDEIRAMAADGTIEALFEVTTQLEGIPADSTELAPIYDLAEELDLPVGLHFGSGPPGIGYRRQGVSADELTPFTLDQVLYDHPKLRLWVSHGAIETPNDMIAMLARHPGLHLDLGTYSFIYPEAAYHRWVCEFVDHGFVDRIFFGTDQMAFPQAISIAIDRTDRAPCMTDEYRYLIFFANAARYLRLSEEQIEAYHSAVGYER